jgi:signal transduction histidine kinase
MTGALSAGSRARPAVQQAWRGLAGVLLRGDPAPSWRSPWHRRAAHAALAAATLVAGLVSLASLVKMPSLIGLPGFLSGSAFLGGSALINVHAAISPHAAIQAISPHAAVNGPAPSTARPDFRSRHGQFDFSSAHSSPVRPPRFGPPPPEPYIIHLFMQPGATSLAIVVALAVVVALVVVVPLPLAGRYPLLGWRIGWLALLLVPLAGISWWKGWPWGPAQLLALLVVFCVAGVRHPRPVLWWMWALSLVPFGLQESKGRLGWLGCALGTVAFTAAAVAVDAVAARRRAQQALAGQAELAELEQARRAVLEERAKIARELHDVVAHHMSLIAVRAETAPYRLAGLPEPVADEFGSLSEAARAALADMRRLLGVLRHDQPAARAPQPQLSDLPTLIETARQAGVAVALSAPPALGQVPSGVGVCAYRIVQESLSNASRHAPGAPVTVSVDHAASAVLLQVANGPAATSATTAAASATTTDGSTAAPSRTSQTAAASGHGPGQGLAGMRERVALLGGALTAGPSPDGGFIVSAVLPLGAAA